MAWVIVKDGAVVREFSRPTAFTYEGYQYPANWIQNATNAEKSAMGLVEVTISGKPKDGEYYNNSLSDEIMTNKTALSVSYGELQRLVPYIKVDMTSALGVLITYQDNDGD